MTTNRYKYFRWTPRTARITFVWVVVVPSLIGYAAYKTDVSGRSTSQRLHSVLTRSLNTGIMGFPREEERRPARGAVDEHRLVGKRGWLYISLEQKIQWH